jgi:hypothetical protein
MLPRVPLVASIAFPVAAFFAACSAGDVSPPPPLSDGGATVEGGGAESSSGGSGPVQQGSIRDLTTSLPVASAKLTLGAATATTDANGKYQVTVDGTKSFNMKVEKDGYYTLTEQETLVKQDIDLGVTSFLPESTAALLTASLAGYDPGKGVLSLAIENHGCTDEGGATFTVTGPDGKPPAGSTLVYAVGSKPSLPSASATSAQKDAFPHAVAFNLPPNVPISVTVQHPTCTMVQFPVDKQVDTGTVTYVSATVATLPGKATSFLRLFLK